MIYWFLLIPARVPGLVSLLFFFFLVSGKGACSIMISWSLLVPALVSLLVSSLMIAPRKKSLSYHYDFLVSCWF